ncbi:hypothetical protein BDA99DRAFT_609051 [Phascolomyces articulosus]|uniref:F-box domain-containing protein n=1 Tax=Phascolomyces articulosus TaxID=60185 RepID=A0AAD5K0D1_9FUNG|nr:hypothetical protein BDA99DRAFT_609051 [Phascolomyces articulosus]
MNGNHGEGHHKNPVGQLPHEIIAAIISFLPFRHRIRCLQLSSSWRRYLLDSPLLWSTLDDPECDLSRDLLVHKQHIKKDWIHHVDIDSLNVDQQKRAFDFLIELECSSIRSFNFSFRGEMLSSLRELLDYSGNTITSIHATVAPLTRYFLETILTQCPHLESIKYMHRQSLARGRLFHDNFAFSQPFIESRKQLEQYRAAGTTPEGERLPKGEDMHFKVKSMHFIGVAPIRQFLNGDVDLPHLEYLNIFCPSNNLIQHIQPQGWPQLRYLYLSGVNFAPEAMDAFVKAIPNIPHLMSMNVSGSCITPTNEFLMALGDLEHLQELGFLDWQTYMKRRRLPPPTPDLAAEAQDNDNDHEEEPPLLDIEEGLIYLLKGKCRRTLQKLKLVLQGRWSDRILAAIPHQQYQQQLMCFSLSMAKAVWHQQPSSEEEEQKEDPLLLTDNGLRSFASNMANHKMEFLGLFNVEKDIDSDMCQWMKNTLGPNLTLTFRDGTLNANAGLGILENGEWRINSAIYPLRKLPSACQNVPHYI